MWLTAVSIRRPAILLALLALVIVGGLTAYTKLGVDLLPAVDFPIVAVTTVYPGAAAEEVDGQVTGKVIDAVSGMNDIDYIDATSVEGTSAVVIYFTDRAARDSASEVQRRVDSIRGDLPADAKSPSVDKFDPSSTPVISLALSGSRDLGQLQRLAETRLKGKLEALNGVAQVSIVGGLQREIQVQVDPQKLQATGLSVLQVNQALGSDNLSAPAGSISERDQDFTLRLNALAQSPADLADVLVASTPSGPVQLSDVATIVDTYHTPTTIQRSNGRPAVGITVQKQTGANSVAVAEAVKQVVAQVSAELPPDTQLSTVVDSSVFTRQSIADVGRELGQAVVLTGLVLLAFLHTFRSTAIVLLSIPTSLIATLGAAYVLGLTLNTITLMGLTLTVGILVDDSIVVLENIFRHRWLGEDPRVAALRGRSEIGLAAIAITLVDVVVFLPLAFMTGPVGGYFRQFGIVVSVATLFSLLMSFTLTPMLASHWLVDRRVRVAGPPWNRTSAIQRLGYAWDRSYEGLAHAYAALVGVSLRVPWLVVALGAASCAAGLWLLLSGTLATEYAPNPDNSQFVVTVELPAGTTLDATDAAVRTVESRLRAWPEVSQVFTSVGVGGSGALDLNRARFATLQVGLVPRSQRHLDPTQLAQKARALGADLPGVTVRANPVGLLGQGRPTEVDVIVQGDAPDTLDDIARQVARVLHTTPGLADVTDGGTSGRPEVVASVDRRRAADLGIAPSQIAAVLRTGLTGNVASTFRPDGSTSWPIRVMLDPAERGTTGSVADIPIVSPRGATTLGQLADISITSGPSTIARHGRLRSVTATASLTGEQPLGSVTRDLRASLSRISLPTGYAIVLGGAVQRQTDTFGQVGQALMLSIAMMYVLLVLLYSSWLQPLVRMLSLPLGLFGAFGLLAVTGHTLNLMSLIGLILTEGLVGKNAILLIDYTNTLRHRGLPRHMALVEAARTRLRPILMTSATIVLAMLPVALSIGEGSEWRVPMAITVIGGLLSSTLLALVFVPSVYTLLDDLEGWLRRLLHIRSESAYAAEPSPLHTDGVENGVGAHFPIPAAREA